MALAFLDDQNRDFVECLPHVDLRKHFEIIRELGRGCFAKVVLVRRKDTGEYFAAKMVRLEQSPGSSSPLTETGSQPSSVHYRRAKDQFQFELTLAYFLSPCPYIIRTQSDAFRTNHHMIALMEPAMGGDLSSKLNDPHTRIGEQQLKAIAIQLASAIQFIHERSLVHGDIRLENVLIVDDSSFSVVKLGDFSRTKKSGSMVRYGTVMMAHQNNSPNLKRAELSLAPHTPHEQASRRSSISTAPASYPGISGADSFSPPEIVELSPSDFYTVHASQDVWGYGLVLFCLTIERTPSWKICSLKSDPIFGDFIEALNSNAAPGHFSASAPSCDLSKPSLDGSLAFYHQSMSRLTPSFVTLFRGLLDLDPSNRSPIKTVRNFTLQKWLTQELKPKSLSAVSMPIQKLVAPRISPGTSSPAISTVSLNPHLSPMISPGIRSKMVNSHSMSSENSGTGLARAQSETALNEFNSELPKLVANGSASSQVHTTSTSTSFTDSTGDPASPKSRVPPSGSLIPDTSCKLQIALPVSQTSVPHSSECSS